MKTDCVGVWAFFSTPSVREDEKKKGIRADFLHMESFSSSKLSPPSLLLFTCLLFVSHINFSMLPSESVPLFFLTLRGGRGVVAPHCLLHFALVRQKGEAGSPAPFELLFVFAYDSMKAETAALMIFLSRCVSFILQRHKPSVLYISYSTHV